MQASAIVKVACWDGRTWIVGILVELVVLSCVAVRQISTPKFRQAEMQG